MKKLMIIGISCALVASFGVGSAIAKPGSGNGQGNSNGKAGGKLPKAKQIASRQCAVEKRAIGNKAFKALYGKRAMRTCKRAHGGSARADIANAAQACNAELSDPNFATEHGGSTFAEVYGTNANDKNAFGKCVSSKVSQKLFQDQAKMANAAQVCRTQRSDPNFATEHGGKTFAEFYGTNRNDRNAFGKCVASTTATTATA